MFFSSGKKLPPHFRGRGIRIYGFYRDIIILKTLIFVFIQPAADSDIAQAVTLLFDSHTLLNSSPILFP